MPTDISHYPYAQDVLYEFLDAKIPLTRDDFRRRLRMMEPPILGDHLDGLWRIGMIRKLRGDGDPYVLTPLGMEAADLFGETGWDEGAAFWKRWKKIEKTLDRKHRPLAVAAGLGAAGLLALVAALVKKSGRT